ncbi:hypothetical protein EI53_01250 [Fusobacterium naviforme]|nr:hypothetical protein EI53_01250 [Fusobacterium naviforme]STO27598.1 Phage protein D [Fusobacterium naviforme]
MANTISLVIFKNGSASGTDISSLVENIKWRGRKGSASRTLTATLIDDDGYKHARSGIDIEQGMQCIFTYNGSELFRGIIMSQTQNQKKKMVITAYDVGIYLANNRDTFSYENKTATDIFKDCCTRFGLDMGDVAKCSYTIPELTKPKTTAFDVICDALSLDFDATGIRHYVSSSKGKISLMTRRENILQWVIEVGQNLESYSYTKSIEKIKTRVKMVSKEGTTIAEKSNSAMEKKIGVFQEIDTPDESLSTAQVKDLIDSILEEKGTPERTLTVDAIGIPDVISGIGVFIVIPELNISRTFYVDTDTHTFEDNKHTMSLKLNYANDLSKEEKEQKEDAQPKTYKVGDIVNFKGGMHYVSSWPGAKGYQVGAGPAKIHLGPDCQGNGKAHPWSLITTDWSKTHVWGWVDEGSFE